MENEKNIDVIGRGTEEGDIGKSDRDKSANDVVAEESNNNDENYNQHLPPPSL